MKLPTHTNTIKPYNYSIDKALFCYIVHGSYSHFLLVYNVETTHHYKFLLFECELFTKKI